MVHQRVSSGFPRHWAWHNGNQQICSWYVSIGSKKSQLPSRGIISLLRIIVIFVLTVYKLEIFNGLKTCTALDSKWEDMQIFDAQHVCQERHGFAIEE